MEQVILKSLVSVRIDTESTVTKTLETKSTMIHDINQQSFITPSVILDSIIEAAE